MRVGVRQLGLLGFEVTDLEGWTAFCTRVLGVMVLPRGEGLDIRLDAWDWRIRLMAGESDDLAFVGWEIGPQTVDPLLSRLEAGGVQVTEDPEVAASRGVQRLFRLVDPGGVPTELFVGAPQALTPFESARVPGGFVASSQGLGHVALTSPSRQAGEHFYGDLLGMQLRDRIRCTLGTYEVDLAFLGTNARHHSVAVGGPLERRMHHLMLQLGSLDDLGRCFDRATRAGVVTTTLGRHPNDRMISFYVRTPSGFELEIGWGGIEVDHTTWRPSTHDRIALWGHRPALPPGSHP